MNGRTSRAMLVGRSAAESLAQAWRLEWLAASSTEDAERRRLAWERAARAWTTAGYPSRSAMCSAVAEGLLASRNLGATHRGYGPPVEGP